LLEALSLLPDATPLARSPSSVFFLHPINVGAHTIA